MSLRLFATLALLLGLVMWIFTGAIPALIIIHITCAVLVLVLSIVTLFLPATAVGDNSQIRTLQGVTVLLAICTMVVGYLQWRTNFTGLPATLIHLILAIALVSLIETTLARQSRIARASGA
jgi:hypothetical protein